jgi:uncharacterized membrane protein YcaP (DUF421 family)
MDYLLKLDWSNTFAPQLTLPEVLVRGTVVYFALLALLRILPKWQAGPGSVASLLFVVLLGGLAADAVKGHAESVTDILLLVVTVMLWVIAVDWLSYRFRWFRYLAQDSPTCLIRDGRILRKNLRREMISEEDLKAQLRRQDVDDIGSVLEAQLEADGSISVVKKEKAGGAGTAGTTSPAEAGDMPEADEPEHAAAGSPDDRHKTNGRHPGRLDDALSKAEGRPAGPDGPCDQDEPELRDFLTAARRLQARLEWHREQAAKFKEALARNGVRLKPSASGRRDEPT